MRSTIEWYLLFTSGLAVGIQLAELEGAEQLLDRRAGVAVGRSVDYLEAQPPEVLLRFGARVVSSAIQQENDVLPPHRSLFVQQLKQIREEQQHNVAVGIGLGEREPHAAVCIDGRDQRQSWADRLRGDRADLALRVPQLSVERGFIEPALVDIDYPSSLF